MRPLFFCFFFNSWTRFACIASFCELGLCIPAQRKNMPLHLGCSVLAGSGFGCFNEGKRPVQNGKRLTWWISLHCLNCSCQRGTGLVAIFLKNTQLPEGATRVTPQCRGTPEAFILKKDPSRSWRRKLRASAEVLNGAQEDTLQCFHINCAFWYL